MKCIYMILYRSYYRGENCLVSDFLILSVTFQYSSFTPPVIVVFLIEIYESSYFFAGKVTRGVCRFALILIVLASLLQSTRSQKHQIKLKKREKMKIYSFGNALFFIIILLSPTLFVIYHTVFREYNMIFCCQVQK